MPQIFESLLLVEHNLSSVAALIYQTIWVNQLVLIVGVDAYAVTTAVRALRRPRDRRRSLAGDFSGSG